MELVFDKNKKYFLVIERDENNLNFNATQVEITGVLISFIDKYGQQFIFPVSALREAKEVK